MNTDLTIITNCPQPWPVTTDSLSAAIVVFQIYQTPGEHLHDSHLKYKDTARDLHTKVHVANIVAPGDEVDLVFKWRTTIQEAFLVAKPATYGNFKKVDDPLSFATTFTIEVPPIDNPATEWVFDGASPGFNLKVTVKRK